MVICVEPDQYCCNLLRTRFRNYLDRLTIINKAVSDVSDTKVFYSIEDGSAYNTFSEKWAIQVSQKNNQSSIRKNEVETVTLDDLILTCGRPTLIKIDIEGHELNALTGLNSKVPFITFELNLPDFLEEGLQCIDRLILIEPNCLLNYFDSCEKGLLLSESVFANEFKKLLTEIELTYIEVVCCMPIGSC